MFGFCPRGGRRFLALALVCLVQLVGGCGGLGDCYPVSGKITIDGKPVRGKSGAVSFKPDASQGNNSKYVATATIDGEGNYTLTTAGKDGAPPGWYKVVVLVVQPGAPEGYEPQLTKTIYQSEKTTPLTIEVVPSPASGAYDLHLKK